MTSGNIRTPLDKRISFKNAEFSNSTFASIIANMENNTVLVQTSWSLPSDKPSDAVSGTYNTAIFIKTGWTSYNRIILISGTQVYSGREYSGVLNWTKMGGATVAIGPTFGPSVTGSNFKVRCVGNVVTINGTLNIGQTAVSGTGATLFTLPEAYRPSEIIYFHCWATYNNNLGLYSFAVNTDGTVKTITGSGTFAAGTSIVFPSVAFCL